MMWEAPLWLMGIPLALAALGKILLRRLQSARDDSGQGDSLRHVSVDRGKIRELTASLPGSARLVFFWIGVIFLCVAFARPQWGWVQLPRFEQAREVIIALDLSKSMLAEDVKPSRLARSRLLVDNLLDYLRGERVGLVLFAGSAFTQSPLSSDYEVLREFLPELDPSYLPQGGTDYTAMIDTSLEAFGGAEAGQADRYLIVLSDGESLSDDWQSRVEALKEAGVRVIGLGVGTPQGAVIPDPEGGVIKDSNGSVVLSRLNASTLQALARRTGGVYRQADVWVDLAALLRETVEAGRKGEFSEQRDRRPIERYQIPLFLAILCWALSLWKEFPVRPRHLAGKSKASPKRREPEKASVGASASPPPLPLIAGLMMLSATALAQSPPPGTASGPAQKLAGEVARLSQRSSLGAAEYASLAQTTIETGTVALQTQQPLPRRAIEDALDAVFYGEADDPEAADWAKLRTELEKLLEQSPEDPNRKSQDKDQQSQDGDQSEDQNQKPEGGGRNPEQQNQESQNQGQPPEDGEQRQDGSQSSPNQENQEENSGEQSGQDQNRDNQNQASETPADPSGQEGSERNDQNALGEMASDEEQEKQNPSEQPRPEQKQKMQTVQGSKTGGERAQSDNPEVAAALQRLEKISEGDVPAQLFRALNPERKPENKNEKDW